MSSLPSIPPPAEEPDDGYNPTFQPDSFPATVSGAVEGRVTLKFTSPRDPNRPTFEKLTIQQPNGELIDELCGSARLARLVAKHDPRPGDQISITHFGPDANGWPQFGMNVDKSGRLSNRNQDSLLDAEPSEVAKVSHAVNLPFDDEEAA